MDSITRAPESSGIKGCKKVEYGHNMVEYIHPSSCRDSICSHAKPCGASVTHESTPKGTDAWRAQNVGNFSLLKRTRQRFRFVQRTLPTCLPSCSIQRGFFGQTLRTAKAKMFSKACAACKALWTCGLWRLTFLADLCMST